MIKMELEDIVKLSKTQTNELLKALSDDDKELGLISKLMYIYGRNIGEVTALKRSDLDFEKRTITFHINGNEVNYPMHKSVESELCRISEFRRNLLFGEAGRPLSKVKDVLNYFLHDKSGKIGELDFLRNIRLTSKDFRILRGQHLFIDGVDIKTIHELYHNSNMAGTKKVIGYEDLIDILGINSLDDVFSKHTNINVLKEDDFGSLMYVVHDGEDHELIIDVIDDKIELMGDVELEYKLHNKISNELLEELFQLKETGEYLIVNDLKFIKN